MCVTPVPWEHSKPLRVTEAPPFPTAWEEWEPGYDGSF
jgi:hypothetical protein